MKKRSKFALEEEIRVLKTAPNGNPGIFFVLNTGKNLIRWNDLMFAVPLALLINERVNL